VGRSRTPQAITTPLQVADILALVDALPDPRWRFGFQLMAAYGLRPEELHHLQLRDGRLWCTYEKVASRGKTKPRTLFLDQASRQRVTLRLPFAILSALPATSESLVSPELSLWVQP
jgi:integrase